MSASEGSQLSGAQKPSNSAAAQGKRPFHGSCHCGEIRYIVFLELPPRVLSVDTTPEDHTIRIYKCNCSSCHKAGFFHIRLASAPDDFVLLSPLDPMEKLGNYTCFSGKLNFLFCRTCGVRCFILRGKGEVVDVEPGTDLAAAIARVSPQPHHKNGEVHSAPDGKTKVWRPRKDGWIEGCAGSTSYLSVNATSLDAGQEGLDLREWREKQWILYLDCLAEKEEDRFDRPCTGGLY